MASNHKYICVYRGSGEKAIMVNKRIMNSVQLL